MQLRTPLTAVSLICLIAAGCAAPLTAIPLGEWRGKGMYVDYEATSPETGPAESRAKSGLYITSLKITSATLFGREALCFDIRSERGKLMNVDGTESHVTFTLVETERLPDGCRMYALVDLQYNPKSDEPVSEEDFKERLRIASASAAMLGTAIVLQVNYVLPSPGDDECFWDTFTFEGDWVRKAGRVVQVREDTNGPSQKTTRVASVDWAENLLKVE